VKQKLKTASDERSFSVAGSTVWNSLTSCLHGTDKTVTFKRYLKSVCTCSLV